MYGSWVLLILILISAIPVIAVYVWFRLAKYQLSLFRFLFVLLAGAAAFFPALILQNRLGLYVPSAGRWALFYEFFIRIAFTEELSRLLMLLIFFRFFDRTKSTDNAESESIKEPSDQPLSFNMIKRGTAIGLVAGLGFAILETARLAADNSSLLLLLLLRAITTAPLHGACGCRVGAAAVMLRTNPAQAILRILTATAIHGVFNLMVALPGLPSIAAVLIAISALVSAILTIRGGWSSDESSQ